MKLVVYIICTILVMAVFSMFSISIVGKLDRQKAELLELRRDTNSEIIKLLKMMCSFLKGYEILTL